MMVMGVCPGCGERFSAYDYDTDYVHECRSGQEELDKTDVLKMDSWTDGEGNTEENSVPAAFQGRENILFGTDAGVRGGNQESINDRGKPSSMYRQKQRGITIRLK